MRTGGQSVPPGGIHLPPGSYPPATGPAWFPGASIQGDVILWIRGQGMRTGGQSVRPGGIHLPPGSYPPATGPAMAEKEKAPRLRVKRGPVVAWWRRLVQFAQCAKIDCKKVGFPVRVKARCNIMRLLFCQFVQGSLEVFRATAPAVRRLVLAALGAC